MPPTSTATRTARRTARTEEEEEKPEATLDILDDPVRMYLKQMGQVPLLTREQEVEISKRIEEAELNVQKHINRFGFIARAYLDLAQKLQEGRERFDRVILDKKIESRERYMKASAEALRAARARRGTMRDRAYKNYVGARREEPRDEVATTTSRKRTTRVQRIYPKFFFKQKVTEEFVHLADEAHRLIHAVDAANCTSRRKPAASRRPSRRAPPIDYAAKLKERRCACG